MDVTWQTLIFTGIWTGFWKIICKLPKIISVSIKWLNVHFLYKLHPIAQYQFVGCCRQGCSIELFPCIFDYAGVIDIETAVSKKHRNQISSLSDNANADNENNRTKLYNELNLLEKFRLHSVYVKGYRKDKISNNQSTKDYDYSTPLEKFL